MKSSNRILAGLIFAGAAWAAGTAGLFDGTFGTDGIAVEDANDDMRLYGIAEQSSGKIIAVGRDSFPPGYDYLPAPVPGIKVRRFATDGTLDTTFGTNGVVTLLAEGETWHDHEVYDVAIDSSDRIVITGRTWDSAQGTKKKGKGSGSGASVGRVLLARLLADGALDTSFGGGTGIVKTDVLTNQGGSIGAAIEIDASGRIVVLVNAAVEATIEVVGRGNKTRTQTIYPRRPVLLRYDTNGALDPIFGTDGMLVDDDPLDGDVERSEAPLTRGLVALSNGSVAALIRAEDLTIVRTYSSTGVRTGSFSFSGSPYVFDVDALDRFVIAFVRRPNLASEAYIARYDSDGTLDSAFGSSGETAVFLSSHGDVVINQVRVASNGEIVMGGGVFPAAGDETSWDTIVMRLDSSGSFDTDFGTSGVGDATTPANRGINFDTPADMLLDSSGDIVIGGSVRDPVADTGHWFLARWCSE
ncbi:MAG: NHL repeat-containing protein [Planctomycetota bacterium]|jgi:uncharacterized delta-60 repeat protein